MKPHSLVRQWLVATLLTVLVLWITMVASVAWVIRHEIHEILDASVQETAQRLLPLAVMQLELRARDRQHRPDNDDALAIEAQEDMIEPAQHKEYLIYQVFDASGHMLMRSHTAPTTPMTQQLAPGFQRSAKQSVYVEKSRNGQYLIALAEKSGHRLGTLLSALALSLLPLLALLPLSALAMLLIVRKASRPLRLLHAELSRRSSADLTPVATEKLPQELQPLANTLNRLMQRLQSALEAERHFTANSSHELRTPLAAAMAQLDVLDHSLHEKAHKQRLNHVRQLLLRLQSLSEKLLQLARAESGMAWKTADVDLRQLLQLLCDDQQWRTDIRLHLHVPPTAVVVQGDVDALGIVLANLLENAIKYGTPGQPIHIALTQAPTQIAVCNDCAPLAPAVLARLTERFYRARPDSRGAGLGLAIVRAVLAPSAIALELHSPARSSDRGFEVTLVWPESSAG